MRGVHIKFSLQNFKMAIEKNGKSKIIHKSPLLAWLTEEQPCEGRTLAEMAGISEETWSRIINGRADTTTETFWKLAKAIADLYPSGSVAKVVRIVEARAEGIRPANLGEQLALLIESADDEDLEEIFLLLGKKIFSKSPVFSHRPDDVKSAIR